MAPSRKSLPTTPKSEYERERRESKKPTYKRWRSPDSTKLWEKLAFFKATNSFIFLIDFYVFDFLFHLN